jgi:tetratricopeptide (TPR) repeat protein
LFFFLFDLLGEVAPQFMGGGEAVAHMAHISGTLFGATLCAVLLSARLLPRDQFDVVALAQRWNRRRQYRDLVNRGYDPFGQTPTPQIRGQVRQEAPPDARALQLMDMRSRANQAVAEHDLPRAAGLYQELIAQDANQVLSRNAQLDVANYLASEQQYARAVAAYEAFQRVYANYDQIEQVYLMLGVIYSRYLNEPLKARENLLRALVRLHFERDVAMAKAELAHIATILPDGPPAVGI